MMLGKNKSGVGYLCSRPMQKKEVDEAVEEIQIETKYPMFFDIDCCPLSDQQDS